MRALSAKQPYAELIARGMKTKEYRTWTRDFRGDLLIVASKSPSERGLVEYDGDPSALVYGAAVCVVDFWNVTGVEGDYSWHLRNPRRVEPVAIKGYASVYHVPDEKIRRVAGQSLGQGRRRRAQRRTCRPFGSIPPMGSCPWLAWRSLAWRDDHYDAAGSAVVVAAGVLLTAKHVVEENCRIFHGRPPVSGQTTSLRPPWTSAPAEDPRSHLSVTVLLFPI